MPRVAVPESIAAGTVRFLLADGSRAVVQLDSDRTAAVVQDGIVPLDRALAVGMRVEGTLDASGTELRLEFETPASAVLGAMFPDGAVTPVLVTQTSELGGELALHPGVRVRISRRDVSSKPKDRVDELLAVGDVVAARVLRHSDGTFRLRLTDVDDDEPVLPALRLLTDGPEWLALPEQRVLEADVQEAQEPTPAAEAPAHGRTALQSAQLALDTERAVNQRLRCELEAARATSPEQLRQLRVDLGTAERTNRQLSEQLTSANRDLARLRKSNRDATPEHTPRSRRERFADDEAWIEHEIVDAWIDRVDPSERGEYPLRNYTIGTGFAESLVRLEDERLEKAFRAIVDVLTGRAEGVTSRGVHPLRTHESGGAPTVTRADGAVCMRCAIENVTASARRLHWWRLRDGSIELSRVVLHDDMTP